MIWSTIWFNLLNKTLIDFFSNISAISWRPVLVVKEAGVPGREPPTMGKQLVNFITCGCESSAPFFVIYKAVFEIICLSNDLTLSVTDDLRILITPSVYWNSLYSRDQLLLLYQRSALDKNQKVSIHWQNSTTVHEFVISNLLMK